MGNLAHTTHWLPGLLGRSETLPGPPCILLPGREGLCGPGGRAASSWVVGYPELAQELEMGCPAAQAWPSPRSTAVDSFEVPMPTRAHEGPRGSQVAQSRGTHRVWGMSWGQQWLLWRGRAQGTDSSPRLWSCSASSDSRCSPVPGTVSPCTTLAAHTTCRPVSGREPSRTPCFQC